MKTSETISNIAAALSKAQAEMKSAKKGKDNPFFKSKYADLAEIIKVITEPFANHELSFVQGAEFNDGYICVVTRIMHSSGEWIESDTILPPTKNDAQGYGSSITYGRRYGLQSLAGIPSEDDDGNAAVQHNTGEKAVKVITKKQAADLLSLVTEVNADMPEFLKYFHIDAIEKLPASQLARATQALESKR
jgi:hypothetical protein